MKYKIVSDSNSFQVWYKNRLFWIPYIKPFTGWGIDRFNYKSKSEAEKQAIKAFGIEAERVQPKFKTV